MSFTNRYDHADIFLQHTDALLASISDPVVQRKYFGFIAISAVTVYELAIKDIIFRFSDQKHKVLGNVSRELYKRLNGRISLDDLRTRQLKRFGDRYLDRFNRLLDKQEQASLSSSRVSIKESYANVLNWRNKFAHEGEIANTMTYIEIKEAYQLGKEVIDCLDQALRR